MIRHKALRIIIVVLLVINAIGALSAGFGMMQKPDGSAVGLNTSILQYSPFEDFLIPGIVLFVCNGLASLFVLYLVVRKSSQALLWLLLQGLILTGWIIIQIAMLRTVNYLHLVFGLMGLFFVICGVWLQKKSLSLLVNK